MLVCQLIVTVSLSTSVCVRSKTATSTLGCEDVHHSMGETSAKKNATTMAKWPEIINHHVTCPACMNTLIQIWNTQVWCLFIVFVMLQLVLLNIANGFYNRNNLLKTCLSEFSVNCASPVGYLSSWKVASERGTEQTLEEVCRYYH